MMLTGDLGRIPEQLNDIIGSRLSKALGNYLYNVMFNMLEWLDHCRLSAIYPSTSSYKALGEIDCVTAFNHLTNKVRKFKILKMSQMMDEKWKANLKRLELLLGKHLVQFIKWHF